MATGIGAFISAMTVASAGKSIQPRQFIYVGIAIFACSIIAFGLSTSPAFSMVCLVGVGGGLVACFATANATLQGRAPDALRGRVMGLYSLVFQGMMPIGSLISGIVAKGIGVRLTVIIGGVICGVTASIVYTVRQKQRNAVE
jgi:predicted MFS family arabinose efflux permease